MVQQRRRAWADELYDELINSGSEMVIRNLLGNLQAADTKTSVRLILQMTIWFAALSENEGAQVIDVGVGVVSSDAFTSGSVALPNPATETDVPTLGWVYRTRGVVSQSLPTGGTPTAMWRQDMHVSVDIRA